MKKAKIVLFLGVFLISSCSAMSPIEKVSESVSQFENAVYKGHDFYISEDVIEGAKYRIFHQASTGFSGTSGIRRSAVKRANEFCKNINKKEKMLTVSEHTAVPPYVFGNFPRIEIIFVCTEEVSNHRGQTRKIDKYDKLAKIKELYDSGALTKEEFDKEKKKILSKE